MLTGVTNGRLSSPVASSRGIRSCLSWLLSNSGICVSSFRCTTSAPTRCSQCTCLFSEYFLKVPSNTLCFTHASTGSIRSRPSVVSVRIAVRTRRSKSKLAGFQGPVIASERYAACGACSHTTHRLVLIHGSEVEALGTIIRRPREIPPDPIARASTSKFLQMNLAV